VVAFVTLAGVRTADLRTQRAQLLAASDQRAVSLAVVFAGYLTQTFLAVDASLRQLAVHSERVGGPAAREQEWRPALIAARAALGAVGSISIVDTAGVVRQSTQPLIVGQSRRDDYSFRRLATDTTDDIVADPPFRTLTGDRPYVIPLARRIPNKQGGFGGVIIATFLPFQLREVFRAADVGMNGMVSVFHRDGFVVLREPSQENPIGEVAARQPLFEAASRTDTSEVFRGRAVTNGLMLRTAYRPITDKDLVVAVSLSEDEVLGDWRRNVVISTVIGALLAVMLTSILVLVFREMDLRLAAEETLMRSQRLESVGRLTGGIAHDFNNLLTVILGNVALIRDASDHKPDSLTMESVAQIERAATRGSALVKQLLAFARRRPLQARTIDLAALVRDAKPMLDRILGEDVSLVLEISAAERFLATADPAGIESALLNLCINARDAMPNGGTISIGLSRIVIASGDMPGLPDLAPGNYVAISVHDTGTGIASEHLPQLFEPFFTTKDVGRGTGLGLSTVYGFVKQSGGDARVISELGQGTTVILYIPEAQSTDAPATVVEAAAPRRGNGEVILLVEDEPELLRLASRFLYDLGYSVIEASSGAAALAALGRESRIDLLVTDIVMPGGMSGRQLAAEAEVARPSIPVLYVTGYAGASETDDDYDAARILGKPYDRQSLGVAVRRALDARPM
jgi:signal transduction histidine kinase